MSPAASSEPEAPTRTDTPAPRVWLVNQYFWPDMAATAQLLADLAEDLALRGYEVHVIASRGHYARDDVSLLPRTEQWNGVGIRRIGATSFGRGSTLARVCDYATFLIGASWASLRIRRGDVVVCLSTPPLIAFIGRLAQLRGAHFIYKVEDLYPDVAIALGALRDGPLAAVLRAASKHLLRSADAVVGLDRGMGASIARQRGTESGVHVIPNWADGTAIRPMSTTESRFRRELGLAPDTLVVGYSGNFGRAHRFDALLDAAARLEEAGRVHFLFTGAGAARAEIEASARRLSNVTLLGYQPRESLADTLAASDLHVVSLRREVDGLLFPSKVAGVFAAGRPVLALTATDSALADEVRDADGGWVCEHDAAAIQRQLESLADDRAEVERRASAARSAFETNLTRSASTGAWADLVGRTLSPQQRASRAGAQGRQVVAWTT